MRLHAVSVHFNVTYSTSPLQTFTLSCAAASSSPILTPTLPLSFAWHILRGAAACFFTGAAACFFDDVEACGGRDAVAYQANGSADERIFGAWQIFGRDAEAYQANGSADERIFGA
jgi:hypothetical protein